MQDALVASAVVSQAVGNLGDHFRIDVVKRLTDVGNGSPLWSPEAAAL